jgi:4-amino-4-deoxy-L-arabinose transferase-like glycosyltransferase
VTIALHVVTNAISPYGIHRDAFLYFAMGRHLRLFRMDFPPAIAILANVERLFGDSLIVLRSAPALAAAAIVVLAALIARELGGGRRAQILAALTVMCTPVFMRPGSLFQPVVFDQLWWTLGLFAMARLGNDDRPRWWILLGVAGGLGLLTKFSILFFGLAVLVGLAASPKRRALLTRWPWVAVALALVIGSPSVIGQIQLHFPIVGQMADLRRTQLGHVTVSAFIAMQLLYGVGTLIAAFGAAVFLVAPARKPYRHVAATCLAAFLLLLVLHGKPYYIAPIYPALYATGWVAIDSIRVPRVRAIVIGVAVPIMLLWGLVVFPLGYPVLAPPRMARYLERLGIKQATETNRGTVLRIPQDYADMLGWEAQTKAVAAVFDSLTPAEQRTAAIAAGN